MAILRIEQALAYLDALEADRMAALALSEEKAEEAKLIQAPQEGFRAALAILRGETSAGDAVSEKDREPSADRRVDGERASGPEEPRQRRGRRPIPQLILRELSFSGKAMTTAQIAIAIEYLPDRTETALARMESAGRVLRNKEGRWAIVLTKTTGTLRPRATEIRSTRRSVQPRFYRTKYARGDFSDIAAQGDREGAFPVFPEPWALHPQYESERPLGGIMAGGFLKTGEKGGFCGVGALRGE